MGAGARRVGLGVAASASRMGAGARQVIAGAMGGLGAA
jgi:hypothetical protein